MDIFTGNVFLGYVIEISYKHVRILDGYGDIAA